MPEELLAENTVESVSTPEEAPATETNTPEPEVEVAEEPEADVAEEPEAPEAEESDKVSKKSAQGRIKQLNSELKQERLKASQLEEKVNSIMQENETNPFSPINMPMPSPSQGRFAQPNTNGEISYEDYQRDVQQNAQMAVKAILSQQQLKQEALDVVREYPELDPNSDSYDPDLSDAITESVEARHRLSPNFSLRETVTKLMKPYRKAGESVTSSEKRNLVQQVASGAIRPSANPAPVTKEFEDQSIEEMEAKLGKVF